MSRRKPPPGEQAMTCTFVLADSDAVPVPELPRVLIDCRVGLLVLSRALVAGGLVLRYDAGRRVFVIEKRAP